MQPQLLHNMCTVRWLSSSVAVVQGSFSLLDLQILWLYLKVVQMKSNNSLIHFFKRSAYHPSEGPNNYLISQRFMKKLLETGKNWQSHYLWTYLLTHSLIQNKSFELNLRVIICLKGPSIKLDSLLQEVCILTWSMRQIHTSWGSL